MSRYTAQVIEIQASLASDNHSRVSIDEKLAIIIVWQQAFGASVGAFTAASEVFEKLVNTLRQKISAMLRMSNLAQHNFNLFATLNAPTRLLEAQTKVP